MVGAKINLLPGQTSMSNRNKKNLDLHCLLDEEKGNSKKKKWFSSVGTNKKKHNLDTVVLNETKRRNKAYVEARSLQANILKAKGHVYDVTFERDGDVGFSLALLRDGTDGRAMVVVDAVESECEHSDTIKVGDELLAIYDCLLVEPSRKDFFHVLERINSSLRPLKFSFALGARHYGTAPWTIRLAPTQEIKFASDAEEATFNQELKARVKEARDKIIIMARSAKKNRTEELLQKQQQAIQTLLSTVPKTILSSSLKHTIKNKQFGQSNPEAQRRAQSLLDEAKKLYNQKDQQSKVTPSFDDTMNDLVPLYNFSVGSVVKVKHNSSSIFVNRIGIVAAIQNQRIIVHFTDCAINKGSFRNHPAIQAQKGLKQIYRARASDLEILVDNRIQDNTSLTKNDSNLTEEARAEHIADAQAQKEKTAYIFQNQQQTAQLEAELEASRQAATLAAESERRRQIRQAESAARGDKNTRASIFVSSPPSAQEETERKQRHVQIIQSVEIERDRQMWEHRFSHPGRGALVHVFEFHHCNTDSPFDHDPFVTKFDSWAYLQTVLCIDGNSQPTSPFQPSTASTLIQRLLIEQRDSLLPPEG